MDHCRQLAPGQVRRADEVRKYTAIKPPTQCGTCISSRIFFKFQKKIDTCMDEMYTSSSVKYMHITI